MAHHGVGTILVVDDDQVVADLTQAVLERFGYAVHVARSGEEAVVMYQRLADDISVVVLDMIMPGATGTEVFRRLRSLNPEVRVVILSGNGHDQDALHLLEQGAIGLVQKPYRIADLLAAVERK